MRTQPIIVGMDGSSSAVHAARWAAVEALRRHLPIRLVHTFDIPIGYAPGIVGPAAVGDGMRKQGWDWLHEAEKPWPRSPRPSSRALPGCRRPWPGHRRR